MRCVHGIYDDHDVCEYDDRRRWEPDDPSRCPGREPLPAALLASTRATRAGGARRNSDVSRARRAEGGSERWRRSGDCARARDSEAFPDSRVKREFYPHVSTQLSGGPT